MDKFSFEPVNGLLDRNRFPTQPNSEEEARGQFMTLFNQLKDYNNNVLFAEIMKNTEILNGLKVTETSEAICIELVGGFKLQCGLATGVSNSWVGKAYPVPFTKKIYGMGAMARHETDGYAMITRDYASLTSIQFKNSSATAINCSWYAIGI